MACIFCEIAAGERAAHVLYRDGAHLAFLDRYPIDTGHSLVIPAAHRERITDMGGDEVASLFRLVPRVARAVMAGTGADAFSLAQNNGRAARQIVPHVHVHVIPRYSARGTVWTRRGIPGDAELAGIAGKVRPYLECPGL